MRFWRAMGNVPASRVNFSELAKTRLGEAPANEFMSISSKVAIVLFFLGSLFGLAGAMEDSLWLMAGVPLCWLAAIVCWFSEDGDDG